MKVLFVGSSSALSLIPLQDLISSEHLVCAIAMDNISNGDFNVVNSGTIQSVAFKYSIPLINLSNINSDVIEKIESYQPDIILVSCYANLLPQKLLSTANIGAFNLHPSLLPKFRGPSPLFWQFREGVEEFGVTLHRMNAEFDTGNIISQKKMTMDDGISYVDATRLLANAGSELILEFLDNVASNQFNETAQDNTLSSYQSYPTKDNYVVSRTWSARRIYNFIKAYKGPGVFFVCDVDGKKFKLVDAISYQTMAYANTDDKSYIVDGDVMAFSCGEGFIQCRIKLD